jgi:peptide deformylase
MSLEIVQAGHPVLRSRARELSPEEIRSKFIVDLIDQMRETMRAAPGVGLAAPQIGQPLQLAVIEDQPEYLRNVKPERLSLLERDAVAFHVVINPKITLGAGGTARFFEGCLSVSGFVGLVPRALDVRVDALDEHGNAVRIDAHGWHARILQHEIDHLNGVLCVDRMYTRSLMTQENYARFWGDKTIDEVWQELEPERAPG